MIELAPSQFSSALGLFSTTHFGVLAAGTLEGGHPGRVFVDQLASPQSALLCTRVGYYFLAGAPNPPFIADLPDLFTGDLTPRQLDMLNDPQVLLFYPEEKWCAPLFAAFAGLEQPLAIAKKRMTLPPERLAPAWMVPQGYQLQPYDLSLLEAHPELSGELMLFYGSLSHFMANSDGICLLDGAGQVASACHAVFTGGGEAEISIYTAPEHRRCGLAYIAACAFIEACQQRGWSPVWGCFPENLPSVALARKLGFVDNVDQPFYLFQHLNGGSPSEMPSTNTATA